MNYNELRFTHTASIESVIVNDILMSELSDIGFESFVEESGDLFGYIPSIAYDRNVLLGQLAQFPIEGVTFDFSEKLIESIDWNEEWEKNYFKPIRIGDECLIRASSHKDEPGYKHTILIDPEMAFGTGNHETTYLMLEEILKADIEGKEVLDMGCGTGLLAILAQKKKAKRVVAIDIDEWAYNNTLKNIKLNYADSIDVALGDAGKIGEFGHFDIIIANINRNILLNDIHLYAAAMRKGSLLYMSGFYTDDIRIIEQECQKNGLNMIYSVNRNNWAAIKTRID